MELMTPEGGTIFWTAVTFVLLALILYKVAWKPILRTLEERETRIRESLQAAARAKDEAEKSAEERQKIFEQARKEAHEIVDAARKTAETVRADMIKTAQDEAQKLVERAKHEIDMSRDKVLQDMRTMAIELSMAATEKLIGKNLSQEDHAVLIGEAMHKMEQLN